MVAMISTIDDKIKIKLSYCQTPYEVYLAIGSIYTNETSFEVTALHIKLSSFKFQSMDKVSEGISEIQYVVPKLENLALTLRSTITYAFNVFRDASAHD